MVLKKPYAFLIKHFRIIHLLLLLPIAYLINRTFNIASFFRIYVTNNYTTNIVNIAGEHINLFMYLAVILIISTVLLIYYLMRQKEKPTKLYFFTLIYYIVLFVLIGVAHSILSGMEQDVISAQMARAYRDISFVLCLPQYFFFLYILIRGIGFDIKQFNFANDLKDMEITDVDSEEFEFSVNVESYKVKRTARRFIREFIYYVKENTFIFSCIAAVVVITIGTMIYMNVRVYNRTYSVTDKMTHNYFNIEIQDSMLTNIGYDGNIIQEGKYYLVLKLYIENKTMKGYELDYNNFRLILDNQNIYPTLDRGEYFLDYGKPYYKEKIKAQSKNTYALVYELDSSQIKKEYQIRILEGVDYKVGELTPRYKIIQLKPTKITNVELLETFEMGKMVNLKNTALGYTTFKINNYSIQNSYIYEYDYCYQENNCTKLKDIISTSKTANIENTALLILDMEYSLDKTTIYANNIKVDTKFFDNYLSIEYIKGNTKKIMALKNRTTEKMKNTLAFEVKEEIKNADSINLLVTIRNKQYKIKLK